MPPELNTILLVGVGVLIGCLIMSNLSLRRKVNHLEEQIQILLRAMGVRDGYTAPMGGLGGAGSGHGPGGGTGGVGGSAA